MVWIYLNSFLKWNLFLNWDHEAEYTWATSFKLKLGRESYLHWSFMKFYSKWLVQNLFDLLDLFSPTQCNIHYIRFQKRLVRWSLSIRPIFCWKFLCLHNFWKCFWKCSSSDFFQYVSLLFVRALKFMAGKVWLVISNRLF